MPPRREDTFTGFDFRDLLAEEDALKPAGRRQDFSGTNEGAVLARMINASSVVIRKGWFPETAAGLEEERFALVSLDADLYAPTLAGLRYFVPRMSPGGVILLHDYNSVQYDGVRKAVHEFEAENGVLSLLPLSDLHGSAAILFP